MSSLPDMLLSTVKKIVSSSLDENTVWCQLVSHPDPHSNHHNVQTLKSLGMQSSTICDMLHFLYSGRVEILGDHKVLEVGKWSFAMRASSIAIRLLVTRIT